MSSVMNVDLVKILQPLDEYLQEVELEIRSRMKSGVPEIDEAGHYIFLQGGKRIRASMVLLASGLLGAVPAGTVQIAAALEIIHGATLVHDDIIDQSLLRRGNLSVPQRWGPKMSVLLGDFMYTLALSMALEAGDDEIYPVMVEGTKHMVSGELYQLQYSNIDRINREHYFRIIELKTARFMAACAKIGAIKGGLGGEERENLYEFGLNTGFAFQIIDDTLDLLQDNKTLGKDVGNDLKEGKITLPVIYLMEEDRKGTVDLLKRYIAEPVPDNLMQIAERLQTTSAIKRSIEEAKAFVEKANRSIAGFSRNQYWDILVDLSNFFIKRDF